MENFNNFTDTLLPIPLLIGILFLIVGAILYCFPPKKINFVYGYRTRSAMQSEARWKFAQTFSAIKMIQGGIFLILASGINSIITLNADTQLILGYSLIVIVLIALFYLTENAIKSKFPKSE